MYDPDALHRAGSCDRRRFLGWSVALTVGALTGRALEARRPEPVVMALGGAGRNVARRVQADGLAARYWLWNRDGQPGSRPPIPGAHPVVVPAALLDGASELHLRSWVHEVLDRLQAPVHRVAVVAGLGGRTGSALLPVVVRALSDRGLCVGAYCALPGSFEGAPRRAAAERALAALSASGALPRVVRLEDVLRSTPRGTSFRRFLEEADGRLARPMRRFLSAR